MSSFVEYLELRLTGDGFTTEDTLASLLPLFQQVLETHVQGQVAPLDGIEALSVAGNQLWFEQINQQPVKISSRVEEIQSNYHRSSVEVVSESTRRLDLDQGTIEILPSDSDKAALDMKLPSFVPGYRCWEHLVGHHDTSTDIFSLGMLLASMSCGLDFRERGALDRFLAARKNLFALRADLHPVLARAIGQMTEIDRGRRAHDLHGLIQLLTNYRFHEIDSELLLRKQSTEEAPESRQEWVLTKLREKLFEISRRNRLLAYRVNSQSINLTHASIPLSFDIENIRDDQILVWDRSFTKELLKGKPISLNKYLNFSEAIYLPSLLDRIITEYRRDIAEYGFAQLRLVACFLQWSDLKSDPVEHYLSPLLLLPVRVTKKRGIRDTYSLELLDERAEINPVIRFQLKRLYGISLPSDIELQENTVVEFVRDLKQRIEAGQSGATLEIIEKPQLSVIHDRARRRLEQYRRRARISGRGVRRFLDLDYSYDPANYHPLGVKLFSNRIRPSTSHLESLLERSPKPRSFAVEPKPSADEAVAATSRSFYQLESSPQGNPYHWSVDLCSVTLANFRYRKMSLVSDYESLIETPEENQPFDALFNSEPRVLDDLDQSPPSLADRADVVACDPTQAVSISKARSGESYIIQGPPGTGKSQTITNLIADYISRGKRVLFVCEKRAAIDVVYSRLRQIGLGSLCCLIHDSQTDKKSFVMDLKETYEAFLEHTTGDSNTQSETPATTDPQQPDHSASNVNPTPYALEDLQQALRPFEEYSRALASRPDESQSTANELLERVLRANTKPIELTPLQIELLPTESSWSEHKDSIDQFRADISEALQDPVFANHTFAPLSMALLNESQPLAKLLGTSEHCETLLESIQIQIAELGLDSNVVATLGAIRSYAAYFAQMKELIQLEATDLLREDSRLFEEFESHSDKRKELQRIVAKAEQKNTHWREKPAAQETSHALAAAKRFAQNPMRFLLPSWWRMRGFMNRSVDFDKLPIKPGWEDLLRELNQEHESRQTLDRHEQLIADKIGFQDGYQEFADRLESLRATIDQLEAPLSQEHLNSMSCPESGKRFKRLLELSQDINQWLMEFDQIVEEIDDRSPADCKNLLQELRRRQDELPDFLFLLEKLKHTPATIRRCLRQLPYPVDAIEQAVLQKTLDRFFRERRELRQFSSARRANLTSKAKQAYDTWLKANAERTREHVIHAFAQQVVASRSMSLQSRSLGDEDRRFVRGRRILEHEFGKQMRYKPIRELVSSESGDVIQQLKPVWLMSPLSVSDTLPLNSAKFDVVIFDEASQITLEEAIPSLFRADQTIVVGDQMQLPPTDFFTAKNQPDEEEEQGINEEDPSFDLQANSFLNHSERSLPSRMLGWHYRSRSESLISFSNWAFYGGRLLTVPEEQLIQSNQDEIIVSEASDAEAGVSAALSRSVSFHFIDEGIYERRRNRKEADYIAHLIRELLNQGQQRSIGVIAFSEAQQQQIEESIQSLAEEDKRFKEKLAVELEREEDGQFVGLLVKNLENIQGDERDFVILSICYGYGPDGRMRMNFGPINRSGGEKRLNVAFSRAKHQMAIVSSICDSDITNDYNMGASCLKNYLRFAHSISTGDQVQADAALQAISSQRHRLTPRGSGAHEQGSALAQQIERQLVKHGYLVDRAVGQSSFRVDMAIRKPGDETYRLGILIDNSEYYAQTDALERDVMRPTLLNAFGWQVIRVFSSDWYLDRDKALASILEWLDHVADDESKRGKR